MFTGIVQTMGTVAALQKRDFGMRLVIDRGSWRPRGAEFAHGDSVCISGVCLTLVGAPGATLEFDVIPETLAKTSLGQLQVGSRVNLEPSLTAATPMGGHFVQGHVDGAGRVTEVRSSGEYVVRIAPPAELMVYVIPKGSITVEGVSLTLAAVAADAFEVALIPTTLELTTLGQVRAGSLVNLEADILSKTVVHYLQQITGGGTGNKAAGGLTWDKLRQAGFGGEGG